MEKMSTRRCKKEEAPMNFFFEMKALGHQAAMYERDVLRYIIRRVTDDERQQVMLCAARTYEELSDSLEFMGSSLTAPGVRKNYNNYINQTEVVQDESGDSDEGETWKTQVAISAE